MTAIQSKSGRVIYEGTEKISYEGRVGKIDILQITLPAQAKLQEEV